MQTDHSRDDAVSPVVAFMLLLMVIVSFISVLNAYYIPSLKQQAEIQHLHSVEESFSKLSPDILQVLTFRKNLSMKESIQLGGGDVLFSPLTSSGYLEVNTTLQKNSLSDIRIELDPNSGSRELLTQSEINRSNIMYRSVGNFWINQGYVWEDGVLNITKGNRTTYLQYAEDEEGKASAEREAYYNMLNPRIEIDNYDKPSLIQIDLVHLKNPGTNKSVSSNGAGTIWIDLKEYNKVIKELDNGDKIIFAFNGSDEDTIGFKSEINTTFSQQMNTSNVYWKVNSDNYTLEIPNTPIITTKPKLQITIWNLSIHT